MEMTDVVMGSAIIPYHQNLTLTEIVEHVRAPLLLLGVYTVCRVHGQSDASCYSYNINPRTAGSLALLLYISAARNPLEATTLFLESQLQREEIIDLFEKGFIEYSNEYGYQCTKKATTARYNFSV